jgi:hypothetical protein
MSKEVDDFEGAFLQLKELFQDPVSGWLVVDDLPSKYYVANPVILKNGQPVWFGGVEIKKTYVSVHVMPVYIRPALLEGLPVELLKRKHGKACFNFKKPDPDAFLQLRELISRCLESFRQDPIVFK